MQSSVQQCSMSTRLGDKAAILRVINVGMSATPHFTKWLTVLLHSPLTYQCFCPHLILSRSLCRCHHPDHDHQCHLHCQSSHLMIVSSHFVCWCLEAFTPLSCTVLISSVPYTVTVTAPITATSSGSVSDLCPLSPRQQTDQWE